MNVTATTESVHYDQGFFAYTDRMALRSARQVLPFVRQRFPVASVADFGCGNGGWLAVWKELGATACVGVDGEYVDTRRLLIDPCEFVAADLSLPIRLERRFDLVQSLEVAEHLPASASKTLVSTLTHHSDLVLFSAAAPGQGGMNHINEQPYEYWRKLFVECGFQMIDMIRPRIRNNSQVEVWYRYNTFLYVRDSLVETLDDHVKTHLVQRSQSVADVSPRMYRARKLAIRALPVRVVNGLSRLHAFCARMVATLRRRRSQGSAHQ